MLCHGDAKITYIVDAPNALLGGKAQDKRMRKWKLARSKFCELLPYIYISVVYMAANKGSKCISVRKIKILRE